MLASRTIPCKKCGERGETYKTVAGWFCKKCMEEMVTGYKQKVRTDVNACLGGV